MGHWYGRPIPAEGAPNLYEGTPVVEWAVPERGIDHLRLQCWCSFWIRDSGAWDDGEVKFDGYIRMVRQERRWNAEWATTNTSFRIHEMALVGPSDTLGEVIMTLDPESQSQGRIETLEPKEFTPKTCRMNLKYLIDIPKLGKTLVDTDVSPIVFHEVRSIPAVGTSSTVDTQERSLSNAHNRYGEQPNDFLYNLRFALDGYLPEDTVAALRSDVRKRGVTTGSWEIDDE